MHIPLINSVFSFFPSILDQIGKKAYLWLATNIILGLLEGLGLAIVIPLLFALNPKSPQDSWWLVLMKDFFNFINVDYSISRLFILVVIIFTISRVFVFASYWFDAYLFSTAQNAIYKKALKSFEKMNYSYFSNSNAGHFNNLLQNESNRAIAAIQYYTKSVINLLMTIIFFIFALINNFAFSFVIVLISGSIFLLLTKIYSDTKKISYQLSNDNSKFQSASIQLLNNFKYLISTNSFVSYGPYVNQCAQNVTYSRYRMKILSDRLPVITVMIIFPCLIFTFYYFVVNLHFSVDEILISITLCYRALTKALGFQSAWQTFNNVIGSYKYFSKNMFEISQNSENNGGIEIQKESIEIKISKLEFSFNKDFKININEVVFYKNKISSLVGTSGSGKTTILDLITGIFIPEKGTIQANGNNYSEINIRKFREQIGFVNQENSLFDDTIFNNISNWSEINQSNIENVKRVCKLANIYEFIETLEHKYETEIGDKGIKLSGGQRQRITIARELFKNPSILLLDEATSALDSESELKIKETIDNLRGKMTIIIVAHRLSTVRNSDVIFVMEKGSVIEEGNYNSLISLPNSRFKELVNSQLIKE